MKSYKSGEQPAKLDLVKLADTGTMLRVDDLNADGWVVCGFSAYDPATMTLESRGQASPQQASGAPLSPVQPPAVHHGAPVARLVSATVAPPRAAPAAPATAIGVQTGPQSPALLRARLAECRKKLAPCKKDHEPGSRVARRLDELAVILDDLIQSASFAAPEPEPAPARRASSRPKARKK